MVIFTQFIPCLGVGKETKSEYSIKFSIFPHVFMSWIKKGFQLFRNFICDATNRNSFGLGWTPFNELCRCIVHIIDDFFLTVVYIQYIVSGVIWQDKEINQYIEMNHDIKINHDTEINHYMEGLALNPVNIPA